MVSNTGIIKSVPHVVPSRFKTRIIPGKELKMTIDKDGYKRVCLCKNNHKQYVMVHKIVANAFISNPNNYTCINHKDENKGNNNVGNLEWCTVKYNNNYNMGMYRRAKKRRIPIMAVSGNEVLAFDSIQEACATLNVNHANVIGCLKKLYGRKTCKGYSFEYLKG